MAKAERLIWIDLEMTGLSPETDHIIEIATIVTDGGLNILAEGPNVAIHQPDEVLALMNDWNIKHHTASGLVERVKASDISVSEAEAQTLNFLSSWVEKGVSPMCGNTVCQDRRFLARYMPALAAYFHYRHLDVSTIKELAKIWAPKVYEGVKKQTVHLALADIKESIAELKHYQEHFFVLEGEKA